MTFKKLNKKRKIFFIYFLITGSFSISLAVFSKNIALAGFGILLLLQCETLFKDQCKDNLINNYADLADRAREVYTQNFKLISKAIKKNDTIQLKSIADAIDSYYGKEEENESNKG